MPPLILASASPRRAELLGQLKLEFKVMPGEATEVFDEHLSPRNSASSTRTARRAPSPRKSPTRWCWGRTRWFFWSAKFLASRAILTRRNRCWQNLQGRTHQVVTGVSLIHLRTHREKLFAGSTDVTFLPLTAGQINDYLGKINPLDKAGAYAIQEHGEMIVSEISGSYSNVVGLPLEQLQVELNAWAV